MRFRFSCVWVFAFAVLCGCGQKTVPLPAGTVDRGGLTFDFERISSARFSVPDARSSENLATRPDCRGERFVRYLALPHVKGGTYRLAFSWSSAVPGGVDCMLRKYSLDAKGSLARTKDPVQVLHLEPDSPHFLRDLTLPAGVSFLGVEWRAKDLEKVRISDLVLVSRPATDPVEVKLMPMDDLDSSFEIPSNQCALVLFAWRRTNAWTEPFDPRRDGMNFTLDVALPKGVRYYGCSNAKLLSQDAAPSGATRIRLAPSGRSSAPGEAFSMPDAIGLLVGTEAAHGPVGDMSVQAHYSGRTVSRLRKFRLTSGPEIRVAAPTTYFNGVIAYGSVLGFDTMEANERFADFMVAAGVRGVIAEVPVSLRSIWRRKGIRCVLGTSRWICNGYRVGPWDGRPAEDRFVAHGEIPKFRRGMFDSAVCPRAVYEERPFFRTKTCDFLKETTAGCDGLWANWEPYIFDGYGCFCPKCERELARPGVETNAFRSAEHGKLVRTVDRHVRRLTGGAASAGFVPGVSWRQMASGWKERGEALQYREEAYAGSLKWIEPWGPYVCWEASTAYRYEKRKPLVHWFAATDVRRQVNADYPIPGRPKLMAFPHGLQSVDWVTQPEHLAMALDSYFFNGWEAAVLYFFPQGYDARYWRAFAAATARAARYERYVSGGMSAENAVRVDPVPEFAAPCRTVSAYLPVKDASLIQTAVRHADGGGLIAALNFWQKGKAFFRLRVELPDGAYVLTDDRGVRYVRDRSHPFWTAEEVRGNGVFLCVGASRTRVFEFRPAAESVPAAAVMTSAAMQSAYESARERLAAEAEKDRLQGEAKVVADGLREL